VVNANGGNGGQYGRDAGGIFVFGATSANTAEINANGGAATDTASADTEGGDGGEITIVGQGLNTATNTGSLSYTYGAAATAEGDDGEEGCAQVDITFEGNCNVDD